LIGIGGCGGLFFFSYGIIVDLGAGKGPEVVPGAPVGLVCGYVFWDRASSGCLGLDEALVIP